MLCVDSEDCGEDYDEGVCSHSSPRLLMTSQGAEALLDDIRHEVTELAEEAERYRCRRFCTDPIYVSYCETSCLLLDRRCVCVCLSQFWAR